MDFKFVKEISSAVRLIFLLGFLLIIYGFAAKNIPLHFFWESLDLGVILVSGSLGVIFIVELLIKIKILSSYYRSGGRTLLHILFVLLVIGIEASFYFSDSLHEAKKELQLNPKLKEQVGDIKGFGWITSGSNSTVSNSESKFIFAQYDILVKGTKAYKFVTVRVERENNDPWTIEIIN